MPRCQGTSAGRSNLGVRHLAARPSALAFGSQARRVCEQISNCTPFHAKLHTLSCEKISNCTPFQSLCGFFDERGLCLLSKSKVAHVLLRNIMVTCFCDTRNCVHITAAGCGLNFSLNATKNLQIQLNENRVRCFIEATFGQSLGPGAPREVGQGPFLPSAISNSVNQERHQG